MSFFKTSIIPLTAKAWKSWKYLQAIFNIINKLLTERHSLAFSEFNIDNVIILHSSVNISFAEFQKCTSTFRIHTFFCELYICLQELTFLTTLLYVENFRRGTSSRPTLTHHNTFTFDNVKKESFIASVTWCIKLLN